MKKITILPLLLFLSFSSFSQLLTNWVALQRTFKINVDTLSGSCFSIGDTAHTYIVTAKHIFPNAKNKSKVSFSIVNDYIGDLNFTGTILLDSNAFVDVAVIEPDKLVIPQGVPLTFPQAAAPGFDGYFTGFPLNLKSSNVDGFNGGFSIPLIKKCTMSGFELKNKVMIYLIDGQNNPGFSGGPVFFPMSTSVNDHSVGLLGVISGYYLQTDEVKTKTGVLKYTENSGIMIVFGQQIISEILKENNKSL